MFGFGPIAGMGLPALSGTQIPTLQGAFENMGRYQGMMDQLAQGGNLTQLMGGMASNILDPSTLMSGLGLGAQDQPVHPGWEAFQRFSELQAGHTQEQQAFGRQLEGELEDLKERVFAGNHYQVNENGNLVFGEDGRPILVEGPETGQQRLARLGWERGQKEQLIGRHEAEARAFRDQSEAILAEWRQRGQVGGEEYLATVEQLTAREQEMAARQQRELLSETLRGLPDPDNPGQPLTARVDAQQDRLRLLQDQHQALQMSTPEGQQIQAYMDQMNFFIQQQRERLRQHQADDFDPNAMRRLLG